MNSKLQRHAPRKFSPYIYNLHPLKCVAAMKNIDPEEGHITYEIVQIMNRAVGR
jgi:hypothetical protein